MPRSTGTPTWIDASVQDLDAAQAFYSGLFGWTFEDAGEEFGHYRIIRNGDALVGGMMAAAGIPDQSGEPVPSAWGVYLTADDVAARVARASAAGATVLFEPMDVGPLGRMAVLLDATGALIGLWEAGEMDGYEFTGAPGSPVWFELMTHRFDDASAFYTEVVDARLAPMGETEPMEDGPRYATNGTGDEASWGLCDATGIMPEEATGWRMYIGVASSEAALARVRELGGTVLDGPIDSPFGRIATVADPEGATFQLCAMSEAVPD
ncbi:VOC family protein [Brachybacterium sp. DNPG3]